MQAKAVIRFTEAEARGKIGQRVRSLTEFAGIPKGTSGTVVNVYEFSSDSFDVIVEWNLPRRGNPQDRFAKGPYNEFLSEESHELAFAVG